MYNRNKCAKSRKLHDSNNQQRTLFSLTVSSQHVSCVQSMYRIPYDQCWNTSWFHEKHHNHTKKLLYFNCTTTTTITISFKIHSHCTFETPEKLDLLSSYDVACLARLWPNKKKARKSFQMKHVCTRQVGPARTHRTQGIADHYWNNIMNTNGARYEDTLEGTSVWCLCDVGWSRGSPLFEISFLVLFYRALPKPKEDFSFFSRKWMKKTQKVSDEASEWIIVKPEGYRWNIEDVIETRKCTLGSLL